MNGNQRIIIQASPNFKKWVWWIEDVTSLKDQAIPERASGNETTSTSTLSTAVLAQLPTLAT